MFLPYFWEYFEFNIGEIRKTIKEKSLNYYNDEKIYNFFNELFPEFLEKKETYIPYLISLKQ